MKRIKEYHKLKELFANFYYKIPENPELLLYDFYFLTSFNSSIDTISDINSRTAIQEAQETIVEELHKHMKEALHYAISCELRHGMLAYRTDHSLSTSDKEFLNMFVDKYLNSFGVVDIESNIISIGDSKEHRGAYVAIRDTQKKLNVSDIEFGEIAKKAFVLKGWYSNYGGESWANIANGLINLLRAKDYNKKIIWIDHAYDLQHNTDTVFNKLKIYYSSKKRYSWIREALDWKKNVKDIGMFYEKVSPQLKKIVAYISKNVFGKTIQDLDINIQKDKDYVWKSGTWKDGRWEGGTWKSGIWKDGLWEGGTWVRGKIYSKKFMSFILSFISPYEFYQYEKSSQNIDELESKVR